MFFSKDENKQKRGRGWPIFKKTYVFRFVIFFCLTVVELKLTVASLARLTPAVFCSSSKI